MTQILVAIKPKHRGIFVIFLAVSRALEMYVDSTLQEFHGCKMTEKWPKNTDQITRNSSDRSIKKMRLFMVE